MDDEVGSDWQTQAPAAGSNTSVSTASRMGYFPSLKPELRARIPMTFSMIARRPLIDHPQL